MSGLSVSWRFALVSLRFSLAYEARRSTQWEISDFPLGGRPWMDPLWREGLLAFSSGAVRRTRRVSSLAKRLGTAPDLGLGPIISFIGH